MARHRIVCTTQVFVEQQPLHAHVLKVGLGTDPDRADERIGIDQVLEAMHRGESFYTRGERNGREASIEEYLCPYCKRSFIRSGRGAGKDNDLDTLRQCRIWESARVRRGERSSSGIFALASKTLNT